MPDNKIFETLDHFEEDLNKVKKKFDYDAKLLEIEVRQNRPVAIFESDTILEQQLAYNLTVIEKFGALNESFQTECEAMILAIDGTCRPLLSQNPSARAVGKVIQVIKKICDTISDTSTVFTMSFNGSSLGEVGTMQPKASVVAQAILKFWENHYESMPEYQAEQTRIRNEWWEREQAKRRREEAEREEKRKAEKERKEQEINWKSVKERRDAVAAEGEKKIAQFVNDIAKEKALHKAKIIAEAHEILAEKLSAEEQALSEMKFFAFTEKQICKKCIAAIKKEMENIENAVDVAPQLEKLNKKESQSIDSYRKEIDTYLSTRFHLTVTKEVSSPIDGAPGTNEALKKEILVVLSEQYEPINIETLQCESVALGECSNQKLSALATQLVKEGYVLRSPGKNYETCYEIESKLTIKKIEQWTERTYKANTPLPEPPSISTVF